MEYDPKLKTCPPSYPFCWQQNTFCFPAEPMSEKGLWETDLL